MRKRLVPLAIIALLASCGTATYAQSSKVVPTADEISEAHAIIENELVNPDSAQYKNITVTKMPRALIFCGEVNAKNTDGNYTGFVPFVLFGSDLTMYDGPTAAVGLFRQNEMYICDSGLRWSVEGF